MSDQMIQTIREYFATQPVQRAWLFGSYARGEEREDSDVDILVDFDEHVGLLQHVHIMNELKDLLSKEVDLVTNGTLLPSAEKTANCDKKRYMREPVRDRGRLEHMLEAIDYANEFTQGVAFEEFADTSTNYGPSSTKNYRHCSSR